MSYASLGAIGFPTKQAPPAEVTDFANLIRSATGASRTFPGMCNKIPSTQWKALMDKWASLKALYPSQTAAAPICFASTLGANKVSNAVPFDQYYDQYISTHTTNIDMTPATNTVPAGTAGSWNVSGTQHSGSLYGYNFPDQASAQNYAQAVVDSGGTATMYQVPASAATAMPAPVTGGAVGSGQYEVKGTVATGAAIDKFFADYTSANNFAVSVNGAGGNVTVIDTATGQIASAPAMAVQAPLMQMPVGGPVSSPSQNVYVPPPTNQYYGAANGGAGAPAQTPDQVYTDPNAAPVPVAAPAASGPSMTGVALLIAVPAAAWLYFKHR